MVARMMVVVETEPEALLRARCPQLQLIISSYSPSVPHREQRTKVF